MSEIDLKALWRPLIEMLEEHGQVEDAWDNWEFGHNSQDRQAHLEWRACRAGMLEHDLTRPPPTNPPNSIRRPTETRWTQAWRTIRRELAVRGIHGISEEQLREYLAVVKWDGGGEPEYAAVAAAIGRLRDEGVIARLFRELGVEVLPEHEARAASVVGLTCNVSDHGQVILLAPPAAGLSTGGASEQAAENPSEPAKADAAERNRGGRRPLDLESRPESRDEVCKRIVILEDWNLNKQKPANARLSKERFCRERKIGVGDLKAYQTWHSRCEKTKGKRVVSLPTAEEVEAYRNKTRRE